MPLGFGKTFALLLPAHFQRRAVFGGTRVAGLGQATGAQELSEDKHSEHQY
jgi:hypothetical protein